MTRLLERQLKLLDYLTSTGAIFPGPSGAALPPALRGIDPELLHLEARFSHEKRMEKIAAVFPLTFKLFGECADTITYRFVDACPPFDIGRIENAHQFYEFLDEVWKTEAPMPRYLPDIAECEFAYATVRGRSDAAKEGTFPKVTAQTSIRRNPNIALLRTAFDLREMFESGDVDVVPEQRVTSLAIVSYSGDVGILELAPEIYDLVAAFDEWVNVGGLLGMDELAVDLAEAGIVELRG